MEMGVKRDHTEIYTAVEKCGIRLPFTVKTQVTIYFLMLTDSYYCYIIILVILINNNTLKLSPFNPASILALIA